jgi:hypothetical protein
MARFLKEIFVMQYSLSPSGNCFNLGARDLFFGILDLAWIDTRLSMIGMWNSSLNSLLLVFLIYR